MSRNQTYNAIVLKTYDVGEADRYCILFTRELGRIAARARGVRKPSSRLGGSLLAFRHLRVGLHEGQTGYTVTDVHGLPETTPADGLTSFLHWQQVSELLLKLLHDKEPLPDIFDLTVDELASRQPAVWPYTVRLLTLLGLLPEQAATNEQPLQRLCWQIIEDHSSGKLLAKDICGRMASV